MFNRMKIVLHMLINTIRKLNGYIVNRPVIWLKRIKHGKNLRIYGRLRVFGGRNHIVMGDNMILRSEQSTNPLGGSPHIILRVGPNGSITLGSGVGITTSCIVAWCKVVIEDDVLIGGNCKLYDTDFHPIEFEPRIKNDPSQINCAPIHIKRGAWIGAHSIVLKGVTIGERSVIGAGSVVTKDIPDDEVWAGNPAKFIRKLNVGE